MLTAIQVDNIAAAVQRVMPYAIKIQTKEVAEGIHFIIDFKTLPIRYNTIVPNSETEDWATWKIAHECCCEALTFCIKEHFNTGEG